MDKCRFGTGETRNSGLGPMTGAMPPRMLPHKACTCSWVSDTGITSALPLRKPSACNEPRTRRAAISSEVYDSKRVLVAPSLS